MGVSGDVTKAGSCMGQERPHCCGIDKYVPQPHHGCTYKEEPSAS